MLSGSDEWSSISPFIRPSFLPVGVSSSTPTRTPTNSPDFASPSNRTTPSPNLRAPTVVQGRGRGEGCVRSLTLHARHTMHAQTKKYNHQMPPCTQSICFVATPFACPTDAGSSAERDARVICVKSHRILQQRDCAAIGCLEDTQAEAVICVRTHACTIHLHVKLHVCMFIPRRTTHSPLVQIRWAVRRSKE